VVPSPACDLGGMALAGEMGQDQVTAGRHPPHGLGDDAVGAALAAQAGPEVRLEPRRRG
jgi:hypothetical protein